MTAPPPLGPFRPPRTSLGVALTLGGLLLTGGIVGAALDHVYMLQQLRRMPPAPFGAASDSTMRVRLREALARELALSPDQDARIAVIIDRQFLQLREVERELRPRMRAILRGTRAQVDSVLTPEQRLRLTSALQRVSRQLNLPAPPDGLP